MSEQQLPKKTLYHGEFRGLGEVEVVVKSDVLESKKKKGEHYVILTIGGVDRYLHPENEECLEFWRGMKGRTVTVVAAGNREDAKFELLAGGETQAEDPAPAPTRPAAKAPVTSERKQDVRPPPDEHPEDTTREAKCLVARNASLIKIALKAFTVLNVEFHNEHGIELPDTLAAPVFNGLCFGASSAGAVRGLPLDMDYKTLAKRTKVGVK